MKKLILSELLLLFLATTFVTDSPPPGWYQQTIPTNKPVTDIFFIDSLRGWATISSGQVYDSAKVIATTDGGNLWMTQYAKDTLILNAIQFLNLNTGYCVGGYQKILKSINGGQTWVAVGSPGGEYFTDLYFVNVNTGWICDPNGFGGIFKTTNGGANWQPQLGASYLPKKLFFINKDTGWAISNEATGKLYSTTNGGGNWNLIFTFSTNPASLYFINSQVGWIGGAGTGNGIQYTTNSGFNWINSQGYTGGGYDIKFINDSTGFTGRVPQILKSTDGGKNWGFQQMNSNTYRSVSVLRNDTLLAWTGTFSLMHTSDGGGSINFLGITQISTEIPSDFKLYQNYPNPFNPKTNIKFLIKSNGKSETSKIKIIVYNIAGKEITVLLEQELNAGEYLISFDGTNYPSGIYFYTLIVDGNLKETRKMILIK